MSPWIDKDKARANIAAEVERMKEEARTAPLPPPEHKSSLEAATEAIVRQHDRELRAWLNGDVPANQWRPEKYAQAVLDALGSRECYAQALVALDRYRQALIEIALTPVVSPPDPVAMSEMRAIASNALDA